MSVVIQIGPFKATIDDYEWSSDNNSLENMLNSRLDPLGPITSDPDPDYSEALRAVQDLGGSIVSHDKVESEAGVIY